MSFPNGLSIFYKRQMLSLARDGIRLYKVSQIPSKLRPNNNYIRSVTVVTNIE